MKTATKNIKSTKPKHPNKVNLGVRCHPDLAFRIGQRAENLGITVSELAEILLFSAEANFDEIKECKAQLSLAELALETKMNENKELNERVKALSAKQEVLNNPILLSILKQLKGQTDLIKGPNGNVTVQYNTPEDVLEAMILSFKLTDK